MSQKFHKVFNVAMSIIMVVGLLPTQSLAETAVAQNAAAQSAAVSETTSTATTDATVQSTTPDVSQNTSAVTGESATSDASANTSATATEEVAQSSQVSRSSDATDMASATSATTVASNAAADDELTTQSDSVTSVTEDNIFINSPQYLIQNSSLGIAANFGLVGFTSITNTSHTDSNLLTKTLHYGANFGTNVHGTSVNEASYIQTLDANGSITCFGNGGTGSIVFGSGNTVIKNGSTYSVNGKNIDGLPADATVMQDSSVKYIDIDVLKSEMDALSTTCAGYSDSDATYDFSDNNNRKITKSSTVTSAAINLTAGQVEGNEINIYGFDKAVNSNLVINVDTSGVSTVAIPKITVHYTDGTTETHSEVSLWETGNILWNFYNKSNNSRFTGTVSFNGAANGVFLVPDGTVIASQNVNGQIIADVISVTAEFHRSSHTGGSVTPSSSTTSVSVAKAWSDADDRDGVRPASVTVHLIADGSDTGRAATLSADDGWAATFDGLAMNAGGKAIAYTVSEDAVEGYTTAVTGSAAGGFTVTNTHNSDHEVTVDKVSATDGATEVAGAELSITDENGTTVDSWTSEAGKAHEVTLPAGTYTLHESASKAQGFAYDLAQDIQFTVGTDGKVTSAGKTLEGAKVVMTDALAQHKVTVDKVSATDGATEVAGAELSITGTTAEGKAIEAVTWTSDGTPHEVTLPAGTYTLTEDATALPAGYQHADSIAFAVAADGTVTSETEGAASGTAVTMKDAPTTTSVSTTKTWVDDGNAESARPSTISLTLMRSYTDASGKTVTKAVGDPATVTGASTGSSWTKAWGDLPTHVDGYAVTYSVVEDAVPGYTTSYDGTNLTNTLTPGKTSFTATKVWDDNGNLFGLQPESVTFQLKATAAGTSEAVDCGDPVTVTSAMGWTTTWSDLPDRDQDGKALAYSVTETAVDANYTASVDKGVVTNTLTQHKVTVDKVSATDGATEVAGAELSITDGNGTKVASWTSEAGKAHEVTLPAGTYTLHESASKAQGFAYDLAQDIQFTVGTDGKVTSAGKTLEGAKVVMTDALAQHKVTVDKVSATDGATEVAGAELSITGTTAEGKAIEAVTWTSEAGKDHQVSLPAGTYTLHESASPKGYEIAQDIEFTVGTDGTVTSAGKTLDGGKVVMSDARTTTDIKATKVWSDDGDAAGLRPKGVTFQLQQTVGGFTTEVQGASKDVEGGSTETSWSVVFDNLPTTTIDSKPITYSVKETSSDENYSASADGMTVTNTVIKHSFSVSKVDAADGATKISGATLQIYDANGNVLATWTTGQTGKTIELPAGTYTLYEKVTPDGYDQAKRISFTIDSNGTLTSTTEGAVSGTSLVMKDSKTNKPHKPYDGPSDKPTTDLTLKKIDKDSAALNGVAGATYSITGTLDDGTTLSKTFSTNEDGTITEDGTVYGGFALADGTYTITETVAPEGYKVADPASITVSVTGVTVNSGDATASSDNTVYLAESLTKRTITVSKVDATDGATEIAGAKLSITGSTVNGTAIDTVSWTTEAGTSKKVELAAGTYTLHEDAAPAGYDLAQDIEFTVAPDGTVTSAGKTLTGDKVVMSDAKTPTPTPTTPNTPTTPKTTTSSGNGSTPKTGDTSMNGAPFLSAIAGTMLLFGLAVQLHDRRRRSEADSD